MHFVRRRAERDDAATLLLLHGWPSSFVQMLKMMPLLPDFHPIVPSLPGYGFPGRPTEPGMSVGKAADLLVELMRDRLGYDRYAIRASDLGAGIAPQMAMKDPDAVIALHMSGSNPGQLRRAARRPQRRRAADGPRRQGLPAAGVPLRPAAHDQAADTWNDSPAGLAAWIIEKFRAWSDCGGDVERSFSRDELLTNLTIYWATQTIGSSMRLYYESAHNPPEWSAMQAPVAMAMLPADMFRTPGEWVERQGGPAARWTQLPRGGHFGEWEVPELLADDIRAFLTDLPARG